MATYESLLNQSGVDLSSTFFIGLNDGPLHLLDGFMITRPIENDDILDNTILLAKLSSTIYSSSATPSTLALRDASGNLTAVGITGTLLTPAQPNVTSLGILTSLTVHGTAETQTLYPRTDGVYDLGTAFFRYRDLRAVNVYGTLQTAAQPNVTSLGTLTSLAIAGTTTARNVLPETDSLYDLGSNLVRWNHVYADNFTVGTINTENVLPITDNTYDIGTALLRYRDIRGVNLFGTLTTAAQPNITSVGTLTSLAVTGAITSASLTATGAVSGATLVGTLTTAAQPNITSVGTLTSLAVSGAITSASLTATGAVSGATLVGTLTTAAQPNITSVGTLTSLTTSGVVLGPLGSASNPTYSFSGDPNTGLYSSGADTLDLATGGSQRLSLSTSRVTTQLPLTVNNGAAKSLITSTSNSNGRLQLDETSVSQNPGLEILGNGVFQGGMFYNSATTPRIELWGPANRFLWYAESTGLLTSDKNLVAPRLLLPEASGTKTTPSLRIGDSDTGMWNISDGLVGVTCNDTEIMRWDANGIAMSTGRLLRASAGSDSAPSITFTGDTDTGFLNSAANELGVTTGGTRRLTISGTDINTPQQVVINTGGTAYGLTNTPSLILGVQNSLAGVIRLRGVSATSTDYGTIQQTTQNLHIDSPNGSARNLYLNWYSPSSGTLIQGQGGNACIGNTGLDASFSLSVANEVKMVVRSYAQMIYTADSYSLTITAGSFQQIAPTLGSTASGGYMSVDTTNKRLYNNTVSALVSISYTITLNSGTNNRVPIIAVFKNGSELSGSRTRATISSGLFGNVPTSLSCTIIDSAVATDYYDLRLDSAQNQAYNIERFTMNIHRLN